jgi:hypothetical protein
MNTTTELMQAIRDYQMGKMGGDGILVLDSFFFEGEIMLLSLLLFLPKKYANN